MPHHPATDMHNHPATLHNAKQEASKKRANGSDTAGTADGSDTANGSDTAGTADGSDTADGSGTAGTAG